MTAAYQHPSLSMHVTPEQRDRAEDWLKEAYADGRISEQEFDTRIGQVLSAESRKELNEAFYGLVHVPAPSQALGLRPGYQAPVPARTDDGGGRAAAAFAHFSAFPFWLLGPALVYALSKPGSHARREAAKAFNFTLFTFLGFMAAGIAGEVTNLDLFNSVAALIGIAWVVLTVVGGVKAETGADWRNPVKHVVKREVLPER